MKQGVPVFFDVPSPNIARAALTSSDEPNSIAVDVAESALTTTEAEDVKAEETETISPPLIEQLQKSQTELTQLSQAVSTPPVILLTAGANEFLAWSNYSAGEKPSPQQLQEAFKAQTIPRL